MTREVGGREVEMDGVGGPVTKGDGEDESRGQKEAQTRQRTDAPDPGRATASGQPEPGMGDPSAGGSIDRSSAPAATGSDEAGGRDLRTIRRELGVSAAQLATMAGVSEAEIAEMEAGTRPVPPTLLAELMEELNLKGA
jgi:DNA-binding XRE family transcriptional regulator